MSYNKQVKRLNYCVEYKKDNDYYFGLIFSFLCSKQNATSAYAVLEILNNSAHPPLTGDIIENHCLHTKVETTGEYALIPVSDFVDKCMFINISEQNLSLVCKMANTTEPD